jgi:hypothetical protein
VVFDLLQVSTSDATMKETSGSYVTRMIRIRQRAGLAEPSPVELAEQYIRDVAPIYGIEEELLWSTFGPQY